MSESEATSYCLDARHDIIFFYVFFSKSILYTFIILPFIILNVTFGELLPIQIVENKIVYGMYYEKVTKGKNGEACKRGCKGNQFFLKFITFDMLSLFISQSCITIEMETVRYVIVRYKAADGDN